MERTVLYSIKNERLLANGKIFDGGYKPPKGHDFQKEKQRDEIAELVFVESEKPAYDTEIESLERIESPDFSVKNDFDGEYKVTYIIVDRPEKEQVLQKRELREQRRQEAISKDQERQHLLALLENPASSPEELYEQFEHLKQLVKLYL